MNVLAARLASSAEQKCGEWLQTDPMPTAAARSLAGRLRKADPLMSATSVSAGDDEAVVHFCLDPAVSVAVSAPPPGRMFVPEFVSEVPEPGHWLEGGHPVWAERLAELAERGGWMRLGPYVRSTLLLAIDDLGRLDASLFHAWRWAESGYWLYLTFDAACAAEVLPADVFSPGGCAGGPRG